MMVSEGKILGARRKICSSAALFNTNLTRLNPGLYSEKPMGKFSFRFLVWSDTGSTILPIVAASDEKL
jgi:hypothetical protein